MRIFSLASLVLLGTVLSATAVAHSEQNLRATTDDGRVVVLKVDHTWDFVTVQDLEPEKSAVFTVTKVEDLKDACRLQVRLENKMGFKLRNIVPRMAVYNLDGVKFDRGSVAFSSIKPTKDQYTKVQFDGIGCSEISQIKVYDAGRCVMGHIDKWNEKEGECLSYLHIVPSDLINISK